MGWVQNQLSAIAFGIEMVLTEVFINTDFLTKFGIKMYILDNVIGVKLQRDALRKVSAVLVINTTEYVVAAVNGSLEYGSVQPSTSGMTMAVIIFLAGLGLKLRFLWNNRQATPSTEPPVQDEKQED